MILSFLEGGAGVTFFSKKVTPAKHLQKNKKILSFLKRGAGGKLLFKEVFPCKTFTENKNLK